MFVINNLLNHLSQENMSIEQKKDELEKKKKKIIELKKKKEIIEFKKIFMSENVKKQIEKERIIAISKVEEKNIEEIKIEIERKKRKIIELQKQKEIIEIKKKLRYIKEEREMLEKEKREMLEKEERERLEKEESNGEKKNENFEMEIFKLKVDFYERLLINSPSVDFYNKLCLAYCGCKNFIMAEEQCKKILNIEPDNIEVNLNLGLIYMEKMNFFKSIRYFKIYLKTSQDENINNMVSSYISRLEEGKLITEKEVLSYLKNRLNIEDKYKKPVEKENEKDITSENIISEEKYELIEKQKKLKMELEEKPEDYQLNYNIAQICVELGELDNGLKYYRNILNIDVANWKCYMKIGHIYREQKKYWEALECFKICARKTNDTDLLTEAKVCINQIEDILGDDMEKNPFRTVKFDIFENEFILKEKKYNKEISVFNEKIKYLEDKLKDHPDDYLIYNELGYLYHKCSDLKKAEKYYKKLIELSAYDAEPHLNLALVYMDERNIIKALREMRLSIKMSKDEQFVKEVEKYTKDIEEKGEIDTKEISEKIWRHVVNLKGVFQETKDKEIVKNSKILIKDDTEKCKYILKELKEEIGKKPDSIDLEQKEEKYYSLEDPFVFIS